MTKLEELKAAYVAANAALAAAYDAAATAYAAYKDADAAYAAELKKRKETNHVKT